MSWSDVGGFIKDNAGNSAALIGTLLTGGVGPAVAMGVSMISSATGTNDPDQALQKLKDDPKLFVELEKARLQRATDVDKHIETMALAEFEDAQKSHEQTQLTVRSGDNAEGAIKWVRPGHATISLFAAIFYVFTVSTVDWAVLGALLALPTSYAGLREFGKHSLNKTASFGANYANTKQNK